MKHCAAILILSLCLPADASLLSITNVPRAQIIPVVWSAALKFATNFGSTSITNFYTNLTGWPQIRILVTNITDTLLISQPGISNYTLHLAGPDGVVTNSRNVGLVTSNFLALWPGTYRASVSCDSTNGVRSVNNPVMPWPPVPTNVLNFYWRPIFSDDPSKPISFWQRGQSIQTVSITNTTDATNMQRLFMAAELWEQTTDFTPKAIVIAPGVFQIGTNQP